MIKNILKQFKNANNNEIFVINHKYLTNILDNIINNYSNIISYYNLIMKDYILDDAKNNIIPLPIDINKFNKFNYQTDIDTSININNNSDIEDDESEINNNDQISLYYNNSKDYPYLKYKNENNKNLFKCLRCNYIFNRIDNMQNHFNRQVKCYETEENTKLDDIKKNNDNPIIKNIEDIDNYTYYEKYNFDTNVINYYCNNCDLITDNFKIIKNHYLKRKTKCYEDTNKINPGDILIYKDSSNNEFKYKKIKTDTYECYICKYIGSKSNIIRHFNKKLNCKLFLDSKQLKETKNNKYYTIYKDGIITYQCFYCDYNTIFQRNLIRHMNDTINNCKEC